VAAGTALLTGPNAAAIVEHATRLLTDAAAYRTMAAARNPYGDGYAADRILQRIRSYFAAQGAFSEPVDWQKSERVKQDQRVVRLSRGARDSAKKVAVVRRPYRRGARASC
jgi:hypothetical protein